MRHHRTALALAAAASLALPVGLATVPATAAPSSDLIISEVYARGGSTNQPYKNKFIELYNAGDSAIDLSGKSVQYRSATGTSVSGVTALSGVIQPGGVFVVGAGSNAANGEETPVDLPGTLNLSGANGVVILAEGTERVNVPAGSVVVDENIIDLVGYGTANAFETAAATYTGSNSTPGAIARTNSTDTDDNSADFTFTADVTPGTVPWGDPVDPTDPPVDPTDPPVDPTDPPVDPEVPEVKISEIQGTGSVTPLDGKVVKTSGVVTGTHFTGGFNGFYLMDENAKTEARTAGDASDGIFVYTGPKGLDVTIGDRVTLTGTAGEYYELTQLSNPTLVEKTAGQPLKPIPFTFTDNADIREAYESMLVAPQGDYVVSDNYTNLTNYGSLKLAYGTSPIVHPGELYNPVANPDEWAKQNALKDTLTITLDDGKSTDFSRQTDQPISYIEVGGDARIGAPVAFKDSGVLLDYRFNAWNYQPTQPIDGNDRSTEPVTFANTRTAAPEEVGGKVKLASFNVLNYFNDLGEDEAGCAFYRDREGNPTTANRCTVRGAYSAAAFERQQVKIVAAINKLGADVIALEEIEANSAVDSAKDRDDALANLVAALNADAGAGTWAFVPSPATVPAGDDVIRTAYIYKPAAVKPVGESRILDDGAFHNARDPLAQDWKILNVEAGENDTVKDTFTTVVNHFKSKGSGVDDGANQGNANPDRVAQAKALATWMKDSELPVFLLGDFNAYTKEDPMQVLYEAGYTDLGDHFDLSKTYLFGGQVGSLDHVLADADALAMVEGATVWNINSVESILLEYSRHNANIKDLYAPDQYRSSDHDPVIVGINPIVIKGEDPDPEPTPGPTEPTPGPTDPTPGPTEPTPGPTDPTPGPTEPTPGPTDPTPGPTEPTAQPTDPGDKPTIEPPDAGKPGEPGLPGKPGLPITGAEIVGIALLALVLIGAGIVLIRCRTR